MSIEEMNKNFVCQHLDDALALANEKKHLTISMIEKRFNLGYSLAILLYEMVDAEFQKTTPKGA